MSKRILIGIADPSLRGIAGFRQWLALRICDFGTWVAYGNLKKPAAYKRAMRGELPNPVRYWIGAKLVSFSSVVGPPEDTYERAAPEILQVPTRARVDRVWWCSPDEREQYLCVRLSATEAGWLDESSTPRTLPSGNWRELQVASSSYDLALTLSSDVSGEEFAAADQVEVKS